MRNQTRDYIKPHFSNGKNGTIAESVLFATHYNRIMQFVIAYAVALAAVISPSAIRGQNLPNSMAATRSATVPITLDQDRIVIEISLATPGVPAERIRAWVDNGNPDLEMSARVAKLLGLVVRCDASFCTASPPQAIVVGEMRIDLTAVKEAKIAQKTDGTPTQMAAGMNVEMNLPATILRNYDVLIDFPDKKLTIAERGTLAFKGIKSKALVSPENGLIQIPSKIENKTYNLDLDAGSSISFFSNELFERLFRVHPAWPHMSGAVGPANLWGSDDEITRKVMRIDRMQYGPLFLTNIAVAEMPSDWTSFFAKRAGIQIAGLLGTDVLARYRIGLDYAHSQVYFDIGSMSVFPEFDVIGLTLRPQDDGSFTIIGIPQFEGQPSGIDIHIGDKLTAVDGIPTARATLGQVWSMLRGSPGQERRLALDRGEKQIEVTAIVRHFLGESEEDESNKKKR